jgi:hypothetical protein
LFQARLPKSGYQFAALENIPEHFSESRPEITQAFAEAGLNDRLYWLPAGTPTGVAGRWELWRAEQAVAANAQSRCYFAHRIYNGRSARLARGVAMFHSDLLYLREKVNALRKVLDAEKTSRRVNRPVMSQAANRQ